MSTLTPTFNGIKWEVTQVIPNATIEPYPQNGENTMPRSLRITPIDGYLLHDKSADMTDIDPETGEEFIVMKRYSAQTVSCGYSYAFTETQMTAEGMTVTAYGNREFFALPESAVPTDSVYGGTVTPPTETM